MQSGSRTKLVTVTTHTAPSISASCRGRKFIPCVVTDDKPPLSQRITYYITDEFKKIFINESINGKLPRIIFEECGFNIDIIGMQRIKSSASRWRTAFKNGGAIKLTDTRKYNTGRPIEKDLSIEEKYKKLEAKMKLLQAENELLKS